MATASLGAPAPAGKTVELSFFPIHRPGLDLFEVRAGVPARAALEGASLLLASASKVLAEMSEDHASDGMWGAVYLIDMAKAAIDAIELGGEA